MLRARHTQKNPALARLLHVNVHMHANAAEGVAMDTGIDARQTEYVLDQLARLRHRRDQDTLESLRPSWLGLDAWDVLLEDLEAQRYKERPRECGRVVRLQLVGG